MASKLFGTDGIRGQTNIHPMTAEIALRVGMAAGHMFTNGERRHRVVIGKDTRLSGYVIESALVSGFTSVGMDVIQLGPVPTPAVAMLVRSLRADLGVMISASHNPIKTTASSFSVPTATSFQTASRKKSRRKSRGRVPAFSQPRPDRAGPPHRWRLRPLCGVRQTHARPHDRLTGLKVVVDCANGAAYRGRPPPFGNWGQR